MSSNHIDDDTRRILDGLVSLCGLHDHNHLFHEARELFAWSISEIIKDRRIAIIAPKKPQEPSFIDLPVFTEAAQRRDKGAIPAFDKKMLGQKILDTQIFAQIAPGSCKASQILGSSLTLFRYAAQQVAENNAEIVALGKHDKGVHHPMPQPPSLVHCRRVWMQILKANDNQTQPI